MTTHTDILGRPVAIGDYVTYHTGGDTHVGEVVKLNPRMLTLRRCPKSRWKDRPDHAYAFACTLVPPEAVTLWVLAKGG